MKNCIAIIIAIGCALICMGAHFRNEYVESAERISELESRISEIKNDWDIYNYEGQAVTGAWLKLHLGLEICDEKRNFGYWLFK